MLTKVSGRTSRMASAQYFLSSGFAIPAPYATLQTVGNLYILGTILLFGIVIFMVELNYLDPALSPVYPFIFLITLFSLFFFLILAGWAAVPLLFKKGSADTTSSGREEELPSTTTKISLRMVLTSLTVAFAPVAFLAIRSLHSLQVFDFIAIGIFELLALIYIYKKYPRS